MSHFSDISYYNITTDDVKEIILSRVDIASWEEFAATGYIYSYTDTIYFAFTREEIMILLYTYNKYKCRIAYYALFHEMMVIYKSLLSNKDSLYHIGVIQRIGHLPFIMSDFIFVFQETITEFNIIFNYSFKSLFSIRAKIHFINYLNALNSNNIDSNGMAKKTTTKQIKETVSVAQVTEEMYAVDTDLNQSLINQDQEEQVLVYVKQCIKKEFFLDIDFLLFCRYYGVYGHSPTQQKFLAVEYHMSRAYVCRKIKKVRDCIQLQIKMHNKKIGAYHGK